MKSRRMKGTVPRSLMGVEGFYRVNIVDTEGHVAGDSGYKHNLITNSLTGYITQLIGQVSGSSVISYVQLGSTTAAMASNQSVLPGEMNKSLMASISSKTYTTRAASTAGDTMQFLAQFVSNSMVAGAATSTINCVGLYATTSANSLFCYGTFASSTMISNQAVNVTYNLVITASTS